MADPAHPLRGEQYEINGHAVAVIGTLDDIVAVRFLAVPQKPEAYLRSYFAGHAEPYPPPGLVSERRFLEERRIGAQRFLVEVGFGGWEHVNPRTGRRLELRRDGTWKEYYVDPNDPDPPDCEDR